jgi:hypothetical protein
VKPLPRLHSLLPPVASRQPSLLPYLAFYRMASGASSTTTTKFNSLHRRHISTRPCSTTIRLPLPPRPRRALHNTRHRQSGSGRRIKIPKEWSGRRKAKSKRKPDCMEEKRARSDESRDGVAKTSVEHPMCGSCRFGTRVNIGYGGLKAPKWHFRQPSPSTLC